MNFCIQFSIEILLFASFQAKTIETNGRRVKSGKVDVVNRTIPMVIYH